jgi:hypothetical protein
MFRGRRLWVSFPDPFISGIVSASWCAPDRGNRTGQNARTVDEVRTGPSVHMVVIPPLEWGLRYPEDFPEP